MKLKRNVSGYPVTFIQVLHMFDLNTCRSINKLNSERSDIFILFFIFFLTKAQPFIFSSIASAFSLVRAFYQGFSEHTIYTYSPYSVAQGCFSCSYSFTQLAYSSSFSIPLIHQFKKTYSSNVSYSSYSST